jgi:hypothetical protein
MAFVKSPDRISEAMFCCHSWVSANFAVMASPLRLSEEAFRGRLNSCLSSEHITRAKRISENHFPASPHSRSRNRVSRGSRFQGGPDYPQSSPTGIDELRINMVRNSPDDQFTPSTASVSSTQNTRVSTRNWRRQFIRPDRSSMGQNRGHSKKN